MKVTAIVPVWNENSEKLNLVLSKLQNFVDELVVIDDGSEINVKCPVCQSADASRQITGRQMLNIKCQILRHQINRGQGAALQTGTDYAVQHGADIIVHFDADGQHQAEDIPDLIKPLQQGQVDFVFGSRFLGKTSNLPWSKKHFILPIAKLINYLFTGLKLTDTHNGIRAFKSSVADKLYLTQDKMAHASEYPYLVKKNKIKFTEVPVKIIYHEYGQGIGGGVRIIKELLAGKMVK